MKTLALPPRFDLEAVRPFLEANDFQVAPISGDLVIDNRTLDWIEPVGLVMLLAIVRHLRGHVDCPDVNFTRSSSYLQRMNLLRELGIERPEAFRRHYSAGRFVELRSVSEGREINTLVNELVLVLPRDDDLRAFAHYCLTELLDNAFHHANAELPPVTCAQRWAFTGRVQIAVADCGIGIHRSLRRNPALTAANDLEAIQLALRPWTTGTTGLRRGHGMETHMGMGST